MCEVQLQFVWFISQFLGAVINWDDKKNFKIVEIKVVVIFVVFCSPHGAWYDREFEANPWAEFSRGSYVAFYGSYLSIFKKLRFYFWDGQKFHQHTPFSYQHPTIFLAQRPTHLYFKTKITYNPLILTSVDFWGILFVKDKNCKPHTKKVKISRYTQKCIENHKNCNTLKTAEINWKAVQKKSSQLKPNNFKYFLYYSRQSPTIIKKCPKNLEFSCLALDNCHFERMLRLLA